MTRKTLLEVIADLLGQPSRLRVDAPFLSEVGFFIGKPTPESSIAVTEGLARVALKQERLPPIRQELIVVSDNSLAQSEVASLLCSIAEEVSQRGCAIEHGEVFGPAGPLFTNSQLTSLFATQPVFLPSTFAEHQTTDGFILGVWLVPISSAEAEYARRIGPDRFEEYLETIASVTSLYGFFRSPPKAFA